MSGGARKNADAALITALAAGQTVTEAATRAGVSPATAWRRLQVDAFRAQLDQARRQTVASAVDLLSKSATVAAATLQHLLRDEYPPAVRLGAARSIIELGARLRESQELVERIEALEEAMAAGGRYRR